MNSVGLQLESFSFFDSVAGTVGVVHLVPLFPHAAHVLDLAFLWRRSCRPRSTLGVGSGTGSNPLMVMGGGWPSLKWKITLPLGMTSARIGLFVGSCTSAPSILVRHTRGAELASPRAGVPAKAHRGHQKHLRRDRPFSSRHSYARCQHGALLLRQISIRDVPRDLPRGHGADREFSRERGEVAWRPNSGARRRPRWCASRGSGGQ